MPFLNFLTSPTPIGGKLGSITSHGISDDTTIDFYEKVPGSNIVSLTIDKPEKPEVNFGVLIVAKRSSIGESEGNPDDMIVVTAHPGMPSAPNPERAKLSREEKDEYDKKEHEYYKMLKAQGRLTVIRYLLPS